MSEHVADLAESYVHGLLDATSADRVAFHCLTCPVCKEAVEQARARLDRLKAVPGDKAPPPLIQTTLQRVGTDVRRGRWRKRVGWAALGTVAAAALLLLCLNTYVNHMEATPYDLVVLGQRDLLAATNATLRIRLLDRKTNTPVAGAPVTVEFLHPDTHKVELTTTCQTDAHGGSQPSFRLPDTDGDYELRVTAQTPRGPEIVEEKVHIARSWKIMLSSDKPVYQPGQTIRLRALALRRLDLQPASDQAAVFTVADARSNIIFKDEGRTSRFGISATDCVLASEILEGDYTINCKIGDTQTRLLVEVKKYVLPKFKVDVTFDRPFYQPGDKLRATVRADYFFGKPVANGEVEIKLSGEKTPRTAHTDEQGAYTLDYTVSKDLAADSDASLEFEFKVTDSAGQQITHKTERRVTRNAVRLDVLPENGRLVAGVKNKVYVLTSSADGRPLPLRILVTIDGEEIRTTTNDLGAGVFEVVPKTGAVATVRALLPRSASARFVLGHGLEAVPGLDGEGTIVARKRLDLSADKFSNEFLLRTDKAVYTAGDLLTVSVAVGSEPVYVDLIKEGQVIRSDTIVPNGGEGECQFQLPPEMAGTLQLCAYRFDGAELIQKTRVVFVRAAEDVQITTTLDDKPYRPGQHAKLNFKLTDAQGQPVQGALSLAAVDEAVFSVMRERPGMERNFYSINPRLLEPVHKLGAWSPVRESGVDPRESEVRDQALFSATTTEDCRTRYHSISDATRTGKVIEIKRERVKWDTWLDRGWLAVVILGAVAGYWLLWMFLLARRVTGEFILQLHFGLGLFLVLGTCMIIELLPRYDSYPTVSVSRAMRAAPASFAPDKEAITETAGVRRDRAGIVLDKSFSLHSAKAVSFGGVNFQTNDGPVPVRVREYFPETLRWEPQLITDEQGQTSLDLELADSITSWRLSASAVTADGRLGATQRPLKVFQPFFVDLNLPVALTRGDEVAVPVVVYNYLDKAQTVVLTCGDGDWFMRLGDAEKRLEIPAGQVLATSYRLRVEKVGDHALTVTARGGDVTDAIKRQIEVLPNGRRFEEVANGSLQGPVSVALDVPKNAVEGSAKAIVKIYPSGFSQLVEGLDGIFQMPSGCFEQTSSRTYPNILALDYLRRTQQNRPEIEKMAQQYIHLGYQRLLSFEVKGGGFDWFGRAPANRTLTAYGLMEFEDMNRVHAIDPDVIKRTRAWLLDQRNKDGSWSAEGHVPHDAMEATADEPTLAATAYIAGAVFADPKTPDEGGRTRAYLLSFLPEEIKSPYTLALVASALRRLDAPAAKKYLDRLERLKTTENQGQFVLWTQPRDARTMFHGSGRGGNVETTALAVLALQGDAEYSATVNAALAWLVSQKDARGTWYSTQATVLSLKALLNARDRGGDARERRVEVRLDDKLVEEIVIPANRSEVMGQVDLSKYLTTGRRQLTLKETTGTAPSYQVLFRYHVDEAVPADKADAFAVDLNWERTELAVGDVINVKAKVQNRLDATAAMVMLEVPVPAGFALVPDAFDQLQEKGIAAKYQVLPQSVLVYLRDLPADKPLEVTYRLRATMAADVTAAGARAYEYYDPDRRGQSPTVRLKVK